MPKKGYGLYSPRAALNRKIVADRGDGGRWHQDGLLEGHPG